MLALPAARLFAGVVIFLFQVLPVDAASDPEPDVRIVGPKIQELQGLINSLHTDAQQLKDAVGDKGSNGKSKLEMHTQEWGAKAKEVHGEAQHLREMAQETLDDILNAHVRLSAQAKGLHYNGDSTHIENLADFYKVKVAHLKALQKNWFDFGPGHKHSMEHGRQTMYDSGESHEGQSVGSPLNEHPDNN